MEAQICEAIQNRKVITFYHSNRLRVVEPFTFGVSLKGNSVLSGYQIDGESGSRSIPDWGLFELDRMRDLEVTTLSFTGNRDTYRRGDSRMSCIYCEIQ